MISFNRYISITSGVAGSAAVALRDLLMRCFTTSALVPSGTIIEFDNADDVGTYFSTGSVEYIRAAQYFGWISKSITKPKKIAFARWNDADVQPRIFGKSATYTLASFTGISNGAFSLTLGETTNVISGMDFTGCVSLAAVAAIIDAAVQDNVGTMWTNAAVTYNSSAKRFELVGGDVGAAVVEVDAPGVGTDIRALIGWTSGAILSNGAIEQSITTLLSDSTELSNNFGSFVFVYTIDEDQITEAATWNDTQNNMFIFCTSAIADDAASLSAAIIGYSGASITLDPAIGGEYPDQIPATILGATDYTKPSAAKNYMFQQFPDLSASVETNADANTYDAIRVNYIGKTQTAGQSLEFYQRGYLMGGNSDALDLGVYANEIWFKDACGATIMSLLLSLDQVPANNAGKGMVLSVLQSIIDQALFNGTIQAGKTLTVIQKATITQLTNDESAWKQVEAIGYWVTAAIEAYTDNDLIQYKCTYTIVYGKGDSIRLVEGRDIMI